MQAYSKDQQAADLKVTVNYHVPESEVANAYSNYGSVEALADRIIARKAPQEIKVVFGQYDAVSVIQNRAKFNADAAQALAKAADGPVTIDSVQIENIDFSDAYEQAVEARMTAQVEVQKQQQQLAQEKVKAEIAVTQAQGRADSVKAEADAAAYKTKVEGEAAADAIRARGAALTNNPLLVELTKAEAWNGQLPTTMIPGSAVPFLDVQKAPCMDGSPLARVYLSIWQLLVGAAMHPTCRCGLSCAAGHNAIRAAQVPIESSHSRCTAPVGFPDPAVSTGFVH